MSVKSASKCSHRAAVETPTRDVTTASQSLRHLEETGRYETGPGRNKRQRGTLKLTVIY